MPHLPQIAREIVAPVWGPRTVDVTEQTEYCRFIDGHPPMHQVAQTPLDAFRIARKPADDGWVQPPTGVRQPQRIGEMMQRDDRLETSGADALEHFPIMPQGMVIEHARGWLDTGPLDRQSQRIQAQVAGDGHILRPTVPRIARLTRAMRYQTRLLRSPPIRVPVVPFRLVRGSGGAPEEAR